MSLSQRHGFGLELARTSIVRGWAIAAEGGAQLALSEILQALDAHDATGALMFTVNAALASDACLMGELITEGLEILDRALTKSVACR